MGSSNCAGFGAHAPWYNLAGMSAGYAHELATHLHRYYGHEVLNTALGVAQTGDIASKAQVCRPHKGSADLNIHQYGI